MAPFVHKYTGRTRSVKGRFEIPYEKDFKNNFQITLDIFFHSGYTPPVANDGGEWRKA